MGPRDAVWAEWARAHGKCCKVTFLILLALSLCLLIGGGIMMATNQDTNIFDHDDGDYDWVQEFERNTYVPCIFGHNISVTFIRLALS